MLRPQLPTSFLLVSTLVAVGNDLAKLVGGQEVRLLVSAQEGTAPTGATSSPQAANYKCDNTTCVLPSCHCASTSPPGGLAGSDVPQFITFTADDAIQSYTIDSVNSFLAHRRNPNNCAPKMTYFTSLNYTNYSMVTDWYVAGNEIADHTMTHVGTPPSSEILGNLKALNAFAGIPVKSIQGFRAPLLSYNKDTLTQLHQSSNFVYDSSATSATPVEDPNTDAYWPYTLDNGMANNCITQPDLCGGQLSLPGLWEIPMYATFESENAAGIHLMDPWLDNSDPATVLGWLKSTFTAHYNGNRQPFGLYTHPIHVATGYPGLTDPIATINMINEFLDWAQTHANVWIVSNEQMLEWIKNPVPNSRISETAALGCSTPKIDAATKICNGIPANEAGLLLNCPFPDFPWQTCYGCPVSPPTPANPLPAQDTSIGGVRYRLSSNCSTAFFDPIKNTCLCQDADCAFTDNTSPIGNYTGSDSNSTSTNATATDSAGSTQPTGGATINACLTWTFALVLASLLLLL